VPTVMLRIASEGIVDRRTLALAHHELTQILGRAGLAVVWLTCTAGIADGNTDNPCQHDRQPWEFWVRIAMKKPVAAGPEVLAFSEIDDNLGMRSAGVYYPAILKAASDHHIPAGVVLGTAVAHEVGHLVLGETAHVRQGLMSPDWRREHFERLSTSSLVFSAK